MKGTLYNFPGTLKKPKKWVVILISVIVVLIIGFTSIVSFLTDIQWFKSINYLFVFWTTFKVRMLMWLFSFLIMAVISLLNFFFGYRLVCKKEEMLDENRKIVFYSGVALTALMPIIGSIMFQGANWQGYLMAVNSTPMGITDPIFNIDVAYYMFRRPFMMSVVNALRTYVTIMGIASIAVYFLSGLLPKGRTSRIHSGILVALFFFISSYFQKFKAEGIIFSTTGRVFGAGYTDVHVALPYFRILMVILAVCAIITLIFTFRKKFSKWVFSGIALYIVVVILGGLANMIVQSIVVSPNEIVKESEYIKYNIDYTRAGFGLDDIETIYFEDKGNLTDDILKSGNETIENIRINDYTTALQTYNQLQGIRRYYKYLEIDVDRYILDGKLTQVFISARELDKNQINNTHVNMMYKFTHGMGVSMNAVNKVTSEGQPDFLIKDIPPRSTVDLEITQPRIYYGELTTDSVVVKTDTKEFDYPSGEDNMEYFYEGNGGVPLKGINRLLFSIREGSIKMLVSGYINDESRYMMNREIRKRVIEIAPFFHYDNDPYIIIDDEGKLKWILDGYTMSNRYPYSEPVYYSNSSVNYIRNSLKVVVDAFNGDVTFYAIDPDEPFIKIYDKVYPGLITDFEDMPDDIRRHMRYPEELFRIQTERYEKYHMSNIQVFYNEEDLWEIASEKYDAGEQVVKPYYILMNLPDEEDVEFILMRPYTPVSKNNAIAWLAARNDGENYGQLMIYKFPKEKLIYGPMQIEARIDQNPTISSEITLWNQQGSRVIRGNLLMIPIKESLIYVEPLYIQSDAENALPEVKRIIVAYKNKIVMEQTLEEALIRIFEDYVAEIDPDAEIEEKTVEDIIKEASDAIERAKTASGEGDWTAFGIALDEVADLINQLEEGIE